MSLAWVNDYIGAPYSDDGKAPGTYNCWTLLSSAIKRGYGVDVSDYDGPIWVGRHGAESIARAAESFAQRFVQVVDGQRWRAGEQIEQPGDGLLLRIAGQPIHVGLVVEKGRMLHINEGIDACIERYTDPVWKNRVIAFYRARA